MLRCPRPSPAPARPRGAGGPARPGRLGRATVLRNKAFAACTPEELAALRRIMRDACGSPRRARRTRRTTSAARRARTRPAPHGPRDDAHPRRAVRAVLAPAPAAAAAAGPDPGRLGFDGRLLAQPAAVRLLGRGGPTRGSRCSASAPGYPDHPGARAPPGRRRDGPGRPGGLRLGGRHPDRRLAGRVRARLGTARRVPRRDRGDLLRRPRPRRPAGAGDRDGAAVPAVPPGRLAEPAQGRRRRLPAEHPRHDGRGAARRPAAVRARPAQPGGVRGAAAELD